MCSFELDLSIFDVRYDLSVPKSSRADFLGSTEDLPFFVDLGAIIIGVLRVCFLISEGLFFEKQTFVRQNKDPQKTEGSLF